MKQLVRWAAATVFVTLLAVAVQPRGDAQINKEKSIFTVTDPIEVGSVTLQPGTYLIKVVELSYNRSVVQVTSEDQTKVFATVLATPHPAKPGEEIPSSRFVYYSAAAGQPKALRTWFAPDAVTGQDIIYPKARAEQLAAASSEPVLSMAEDTKEADFKTAKVTTVMPVPAEKPMEQKPAPLPESTVAESAQPANLPATASNVPLSALLGVLALAGALGLHALGRLGA